MIRVRIEGTEEEMLEFMGKMPDIPGFEKTHMRGREKEITRNTIQVKCTCIFVL